MQLRDLLRETSWGSNASSVPNIEIKSISCDSRKISKDTLFFAFKGSRFNGVDFISSAIQKGARTIVTDATTEISPKLPDICYLQVDNPVEFLREVAKTFFAQPSTLVKTIGITGTNGKTTTTYLIESILKHANYSCGVIGTVNYRIDNNVLPATNTTPAFLDIQEMLSQMVRAGTEYCVMEVSSHALDQRRVDLVDFHTAIFTNLTNDHLDYHKTKDNYFQAKSKLFTGLKEQAHAIINVDDVYGRKLISKTPAQIRTYGIKNKADVMAQDIKMSISGTQFKLKAPEGEIIIQSPLLGNHNVSNMLAAASAALIDGFSFEKIKAGIEKLTIIPGRLERVDYGQDYSIVIDYAHTPDALENVLKTIKYICDSRIILVFGCGGDRDPSKRPLMGSAACQWADLSIVTSDNPRSEDPREIINQAVAGFTKNNFMVIENREEAIGKALDLAQKGDLVIIAGKGHEQYQIFKDKTINFDEKQIIKNHLFK